MASHQQPKKAEASTAKETHDHEMESLKNRIQTLETSLKTKTADYDDVLKTAKDLDTENAKLTKDVKQLAEETVRLKMQLADHPHLGDEECCDAEGVVSPDKLTHRSMVSQVPPEIRAGLVIFALGAIRDRQNDAPMDKKNFEHMVDPFIEQAEYIADRVIERMTHPKDAMSMTNEELKDVPKF